MENLDFPAQETVSMYKLALSLENSTPAFDILKFFIRGGMLNCYEKELLDLESYYSKVMNTAVPQVTKDIVTDFYNKIISESLDPRVLRDSR